MARGTTLGQLVTDTRIEARLDPNPALSLNVAPLIQRVIQREQERLYDEFDWPFLRVTRDIQMQAGERYYDFPDDMNLERVEKVDYFWGGKWLPLTRGITTDQYNTYNSDIGIAIEPAYRWDMKDTGDGPQMEIWPIPATNIPVVRLTGIRQLAKLMEDADRADLDDMMLVLFAASEMTKDPANKNELSQRAKKRQSVQQGLTSRTRKNTFVLGGKPADDDRQGNRPPLVAYVRNQ